MSRVLPLMLIALLAAGPAVLLPPHTAAWGGRTAFALLADNRLVAARLADGSVAAEIRLGPRPSPDVLSRRYPGHLLAAAADGRTLFALAAGSATAPDRVAVVDVATLRIRGAYALPGVGGAHRGLAVGARSGLLYLFGNVGAADAAPTSNAPPGTSPQGMIVTRLDPVSGAVVSAWSARAADGHDWSVYQGAVAPDERTVYVSYHGPDTTGIDRFDLDGSVLRRCLAPPRAGSGCIDGHGGFAFFGAGLLAATGSETILALDPDGAVRGQIDTGLVNVHLMDFAVDAAANLLYAVGPCGYAGGFSAVALDDLRASKTPVTLVTQGPNPDGPYAPCGERVALGPGSALLVAQATGGLLGVDLPGRLLVLDRASGSERFRVATASTPIDVLATV